MDNKDFHHSKALFGPSSGYFKESCTSQTKIQEHFMSNSKFDFV